MQKHLKLSIILLPVAFVTLVGIYVYSLWTSEKRRSAEVPVVAFEVMVRDLRSFHKKRGGFPKDLKEMEGIVWGKKETREFSNNGCGLIHGNYHYLYTPRGPHEFTLWAVPTGRQREEAATWFVTATPESQRRWKGPALMPNDIKSVDVYPSVQQLSVLGLIEQPTTLSTK